MTQHRSDVVLYEQRGHVAVITLNRPDRLNAWTAEMGARYWDLLDAATADPTVRAIVVTGAGRGFCAGADMDLLQSIGAGDRPTEPVRDEHQTYTIGVPKPVIGAINGACAGLGLVQATMFDVRFAAEGAKFTTAFGRRGLIAEHGIAWMLPRIVGHANAMDLLLSARIVLADEAQQMGLVNKVVPATTLMAETLAYADDIAEHVAPSSMRVIKRQLTDGWDFDLEASNRDTTAKMIHSLGQPDFKEGVQSFVERRPPDFTPVTDRD
ncbi:MAG: enoyl-CoA hydratase [Ilumatobacter sp.]|nr:enoyl-CoA hydratase [Ilumatobacter sp.]